MIYLPWITFLLAILWMVRQGDRAKKTYLRRQAEERERSRQELREDEVVEGLKARGQGQTTGLAETFGGGGQRRGSAYGTGSSSVS